MASVNTRIRLPLNDFPVAEVGPVARHIDTSARARLAHRRRRARATTRANCGATPFSLRLCSSVARARVSLADYFSLARQSRHSSVRSRFIRRLVVRVRARSAFRVSLSASINPPKQLAVQRGFGRNTGAAPRIHQVIIIFLDGF